MNTELVVGGLLGFEMRRAEADRGALRGKTRNAIVQSVGSRDFVTGADPAFQCPLGRAGPNQIGTRRERTTKRAVVFVSAAKCQTQVLVETPFVFQVRCPGILLKGVAG